MKFFFSLLPWLICALVIGLATVLYVTKSPPPTVVKKLMLPANASADDVRLAFSGVKPLEYSPNAGNRDGRTLICGLWTDDKDTTKPPVAEWIAQVCYFAPDGVPAPGGTGGHLELEG